MYCLRGTERRRRAVANQNRGVSHATCCAGSAKYSTASHDGTEPAGRATKCNGRHARCADASQEHGMSGFDWPRPYDCGKRTVTAR